MVINDVGENFGLHKEHRVRLGNQQRRIEGWKNDMTKFYSDQGAPKEVIHVMENKMKSESMPV